MNLIPVFLMFIGCILPSHECLQPLEHFYLESLYSAPSSKKEKPDSNKQKEQEEAVQQPITRDVAVYTTNDHTYFPRLVKFALPGDSAEVVTASVESVAKFISERSGYVLSDLAKQRLVALEMQVTEKKANRLDVDKIVDLAAETCFDRVAMLTDSEIAHAIHVLRGDQMEVWLRLRWNGSVAAEAGEITSTLESWRNLSRKKSQAFLKLLRGFLKGEEKGRGILGLINVYQATMPGTFNKKDLFSPLQTMVILYSVASDDSIETPTRLFRQMMEDKYLSSKQPITSPRGRTPFGTNGYLFPMPIDLILDDRTLTVLFDLMEKKIRK